jgi:hypothetical protein
MGRRIADPAGIFHPGEPFPRQIQPMRIEEFDQCNFLRPPPAFELFFATDCFLNIIERLPVQQTRNLGPSLLS